MTLYIYILCHKKDLYNKRCNAWMICLDFVELGILYGVITMVKPSFFQRHVGCHKMPGKAAKSSAKPKKVGKQLSTLEL